MELGRSSYWRRIHYTDFFAATLSRGITGYPEVRFPIACDPLGDSPELEQAPQGRYPVAMDPDNPIIRLCVQGTECESSGRLAEALEFFMSAWMRSKDDFERCIAAHYVARHQEEPVDALMWNQRSLDHANAVADERIREFYPSLYLNMGKAHEDLGNRDDAKRFYQTAETLLGSLPMGQYSTVVRGAVERALVRIRQLE